MAVYCEALFDNGGPSPAAARDESGPGRRPGAGDGIQVAGEGSLAEAVRRQWRAGPGAPGQREARGMGRPGVRDALAHGQLVGVRHYESAGSLADWPLRYATPAGDFRQGGRLLLLPRHS